MTHERRFEPGDAFDDSEGLLLAAEVADMYAVDGKTVLSWAKLGKLPHILTPGNQYRFSAAYHRRHLLADGR